MNRREFFAANAALAATAGSKPPCNHWRNSDRCEECEGTATPVEARAPSIPCPDVFIGMAPAGWVPHEIAPDETSPDIPIAQQAGGEKNDVSQGG